MIVVQQIESAVLEPYFVGKQVGVPPIFTILAVTLAGKYAGFLGILLAVPVTGVFLIYIKRFIEKEKLKYIQKD
jgi:predicted PurR-regulated permease PerM